VWEPDRSSIMSDDVRNLLLTNVLFDNFCELEGRLFEVNLVGNESSFGIKKDSEMLIGFIDADNIHLTKWISWISSDLSINFDQTFSVLNNFPGFISSNRIL